MLVGWRLSQMVRIVGLALLLVVVGACGEEHPASPSTEPGPGASGMPPELGSGDSVPLRRVIVYLDPQTPPHLLGEVATGLTSPPNIAPGRSAGLRAAGVDEENKALVLTFDGTSGRDGLRCGMSTGREKVGGA